MERRIFIDREDCKIIEEEERNIFIKGVLEEIGVPLEEVWPEIILSLENKIKLRNLLSKLDIEVIEEDRGYKIYCDNSLLAEWCKPRFILRKDPAARVPSKKLYYEMVIKTWSVYEDQQNKE
jgi:hypothetical protein